MTISTTTHLNFRGSARRALEFYQGVFGGRMTAVSYAEMGMPADAPGADHVVFGQLESDAGFRVMAYDIPGTASTSSDGSSPLAPDSATTTATTTTATTHRENGVTVTDSPFFLSVRGSRLEEIEGYWTTLAEGAAAIVEPLAASAWSAGFGMLTDRFGVTWILDVEATPAD